MECENAIEKAYSDEMFRAVGILFLTSANVEIMLSFALARVVSHPRQIRTYEMWALNGMETKVKLEKIAVGAHLQFPDRGAEVRRLCGKIRAGFQRRNDIAHNMDTSIDPDTLELAIIRLKQDGSMAGDKLYKPRQIRGFAATLRARARALDELLTDIGFAVTKRLTE